MTATSGTAARLILINGAPVSGKSTLARLLVDGIPLALVLDIDSIRGMLGRWYDDPTASGVAARATSRCLRRGAPPIGPRCRRSPVSSPGGLHRPARPATIDRTFDALREAIARVSRD